MSDSMSESDTAQNEKVLSIISQVSSTERYCDEETLEALAHLNNAETLVKDLINQSPIVSSTELRSKLNSAIIEARLQIDLPWLTNRTNIMCIGDSQLLGKNLLQKVLEPSAISEFLQHTNFSVPIVLYHAEEEEVINQALVYNLADNCITMAQDDVMTFLSLAEDEHNENEFNEVQDSAAIHPQHLAQLCALPLRFKDQFRNLCLILANTFNPVRNSIAKQLAQLCRAAVIMDISTPVSDLAIFPLEIKILKAANDSEPDNWTGFLMNKVSGLLQKTEESKNLQVYKDLSSMPNKIEIWPDEQVVSWLSSLNQVSENLHLKQHMDELLLLLHLAASKNQQQNNALVTNLNQFMIDVYDQDSSTHDSDGCLESIVEQSATKRDVIQNMLKQIEKTQILVTTEIEQLQQALVSKSESSAKANKAKTASSDSDESSNLSASGIQVLRDTTSAALKIRRFKLAQNCINVGQSNHDPEAFLAQLYLNHSQRNKRITLNEINSLAFEPNSISKTQAIIDLVNEVPLADKGARITNIIPEEKYTAFDYFILACCYQQKGQASKGIEAFETAWFMGENKAVPQLMTIYLNQLRKNQSPQLLDKIKLLAEDTFDPQATYAYGNFLMQNNDEKAGENYLIISACQGYRAAIEELADKYWAKVQAIRGDDDANVIVIRKSLYLNLYLDQMDNGSDPIRKAKIGTLFTMLKKFDEAVPYLVNAINNGVPDSRELAYNLGLIFYNGGHGVVKDLDQAKHFLLLFDPNCPELKQIEAEERQAEEVKRSAYRVYHDYSSLISYSSYSDGGGCFITTATCESAGKPDDCAELTLMRKFRDEILLKQEAGQELVKEYYRIAPTIVSRIQAEPQSKEIFKEIYQQSIQPSYEALLHQDYQQTLRMYVDCVQRLAKHYGVAINDENLKDIAQGIIDTNKR